MSRTLAAAREIQRTIQVAFVFRTRALVLRAANAIAMLSDGIREGVTAYRKYKQLRAQGAAHEDAIKSVQADSDRIKHARKIVWK